MKRKIQGKYVTVSTLGEKAQAFVPSPLPPDPPIKWTGELTEKFDRALLLLGKLDSISTILPETAMFLYMYVRKEAVLSSMIEGTQSSLSDFLLFELDEHPGYLLDDVREVSNYVAALEYGLQLLNDGLPVSLRLFRQIHSVLLGSGRGSDKLPGEFRRSQNWIGGSRPGNAVFVPPPPEEVLECMSKLELFLHDEPEPTSVLVKAALAHVQFETIHPFLDGNGRLGRLLITLLLCDRGVLRKPMLYLSLYFKTHRQFYYELLDRVRRTGDWEGWLDFFADAVISTAKSAIETAQRLIELSNEDVDKIKSLGRKADSALQIHKIFREYPVVNTGSIVEKTGISPATVNKTIEHMKKLGIISEITGRRRNRVFCYTKYLEIMNQGTEFFSVTSHDH
ncbi:Fic family protein [Myxococcota bacterium]|nr:Fic family protein [Myxococcota bacterium]MBU1379321.1 Fic family protein [Myxococcota bacterium]MBU1497004.1 Fic family protein [Myxococcota bacterium]